MYFSQVLIKHTLFTHQAIIHQRTTFVVFKFIKESSGNVLICNYPWDMDRCREDGYFPYRSIMQIVYHLQGFYLKQEQQQQIPHKQNKRT